MAGKRNRLCSSRFLAVINPHDLRHDMVRSVASPLPVVDLPGMVTRIGHIGVAAEWTATGAFKHEFRDISLYRLANM
jgi:hypothetical protein